MHISIYIGRVDNTQKDKGRERARETEDEQKGKDKEREIVTLGASVRTRLEFPNFVVPNFLIASPLEVALIDRDLSLQFVIEYRLHGS